MAEKKDIRGVEVHVFDEKKNNKGSTKMRIIDWIIDGKHYLNFEKRDFFSAGGEEKMGKAKGFNFSDMKIVKENMAEILARLEDRPADEPVTAQPATSVADEGDGQY